MKKAILFINLGTPQNWDLWSVAKYLNQFLTDPRVISLPWFVRHILVKFFIIPSRIFSTSKNYRSIWGYGRSPLAYHSSLFMQKITPLLKKKGIEPFFAMRYQEPSIESVMKQISFFSPDTFTIIPLYPQYASATTGSSIEACYKAIQKWHFFPKITLIPSFYDKPWFLEVWKQKILQQHKPHSHLIFCFHGLPQKQVKMTNPRGICYTKGCCATEDMKNSCYVAQANYMAQTLASMLLLQANNWSLAFQSRIGKDIWTMPYLIQHLKELSKQEITSVTVVALSFVVDCIETIEELAKEAKELFFQSGGKEYTLISSLNDDDEWVSSLVTFAESTL